MNFASAAPILPSQRLGMLCGGQHSRIGCIFCLLPQSLDFLNVIIQSNEGLVPIGDTTIECVLPGILKIARLGYDGKGQVFSGIPCAFEKRLALALALSVLSAHGTDSTISPYSLAQNLLQIDGILAITMVPAPDDTLALAYVARADAAAIASQINYIVALKACVTVAASLTSRWKTERW